MKRTQATGYRKPASATGVCPVCGGSYSVSGGSLRMHLSAGKGSDTCDGSYDAPVAGAKVRR